MKKKLTIESLKVKSFVTDLKKTEKHTVQGGGECKNPRTKLYCESLVIWTIDVC